MNYRKLLNTVLLALPLVLLLVATFFQHQGTIPVRIASTSVVLFIIIFAAGYVVLEHRGIPFNQLLFTSLTVTAMGFIAILIQPENYNLMPMFVAVMLVSIVVDRKMSMIIHVALSLIVTITIGLTGTTLIYYVLIGMLAAILADSTKERQRMLVVLLGMSLAGGSIHLLLNYVLYQVVDLLGMLVAMANIALTIIVVVGSLPLWESIFKVMTPLKLLEFANGNHKLIQRMLQEAPGTYHHVQMVANLSEQGARSVGADAILAKTGAVYHDIGKLKEPMYFIENQNGAPNPHDEIAAEDSAKIIIDHVNYGVKLGLEHHLPEAIIAIIREHHGTTLVRYFYHKALNYNDGVNYPESSFRYDGPIPQTKEAAIVMLADCVEAFVRSLSEEERHLDKIRWIISEVIRQKIADGQLDDAGLEVGELSRISNAFAEVYNGMYHERIQYPKANESVISTDHTSEASL